MLAQRKGEFGLIKEPISNLQIMRIVEALESMSSVNIPILSSLFCPRSNGIDAVNQCHYTGRRKVLGFSKSTDLHSHKIFGQVTGHEMNKPNDKYLSHP